MTRPRARPGTSRPSRCCGSTRDGLIVDANRVLLSWVGRDARDVVGHLRLSDLLSVGGRIYWETHLSPLLHMQDRDRRGRGRAARAARAAAGAHVRGRPARRTARSTSPCRERSSARGTSGSSSPRGPPRRSAWTRSRPSRTSCSSRSWRCRRSTTTASWSRRSTGPACRRSRSGGDWYDAFLVEDGVLALVVGDVVGRGLHAATAMGQLRSAVRARRGAGRRPRAAALAARPVRGADRGGVHGDDRPTPRSTLGTGGRAVRVRGPPAAAAARRRRADVPLGGPVDPARRSRRPATRGDGVAGPGGPARALHGRARRAPGPSARRRARRARPHAPGASRRPLPDLVSDLLAHTGRRSRRRLRARCWTGTADRGGADGPPRSAGSATSDGLALCTSSSAICGNQSPAAGSAYPRTGSIPPSGAQRVHWPSDSPGHLDPEVGVHVAGRRCSGSACRPRPRSGRVAPDLRVAG